MFILWLKKTNKAGLCVDSQFKWYRVPNDVWIMILYHTNIINGNIIIMYVCMRVRLYSLHAETAWPISLKFSMEVADILD